MSLYSDLNEVLTPYAQRIKGLKADLDAFVARPIAGSDTLIDGYKVSATAGSRTGDSSMSATGWIDIENRSALFYTNAVTTGSSASNYGMAFYTAEDPTTFISGKKLGYGAVERTSRMERIEVPEGAKFARFTYWATTGEDYASSMPFAVYDFYEYSESIAVSHKKDVEKLNRLYTEHENLWNLTEITDGMAVNSSGQITTSGASAYSVTDYIPIVGHSKLYCIDTARYAFYDNEKTYISGSAKRTADQPTLYDDVHIIDVPTGAYYLVICALTANENITVYTPSILENTLLQEKGCLKDKKVGIVGHSGPQGMRLSNLEDAWPYVVGNRLSANSVVNIAVGGSTIAKQEGTYEDIYFSLEDFQSASKDTTKRYLVNDSPTNQHPYRLYKYEDSEWVPISSSRTAENGARTPIVDTVKNLDSDIDAIIIGAGANDYQYGWTPMGTMADRTKYTFYGALHVLLSYIVETYGGIPVFFADAIIADAIGNRGTDVNSIGKTYDDYRNAIIEVCRYYRVPWIDIDADTNFPSADADSSWYADDLKHMSAKGHQRIGEYVAGRIKNYLVI